MPACLTAFPFALGTQVDFDAPLGYKEPERQVQHEESTVSCSSLPAWQVWPLWSSVSLWECVLVCPDCQPLYLASTGTSVATFPAAFLPALLPGDGPAFRCRDSNRNEGPKGNGVSLLGSLSLIFLSPVRKAKLTIAAMLENWASV